MNGQLQPNRFAPLFERVVGRAPSAEEVKEAFAIADVVRQSDVDPILLLYLVDRRGQDARERVSAQMLAAAAQIESTLQSKPANDLAKQLTRIEARVEDLVQKMPASRAKTASPSLSTGPSPAMLEAIARLGREALAFGLGLLSSLAVILIAVGRDGHALLAACAFGICLALTYVYLTPLVGPSFVRMWRRTWHRR